MHILTWRTFSKAALVCSHAPCLLATPSLVNRRQLLTALVPQRERLGNRNPLSQACFAANIGRDEPQTSRSQSDESACPTTPFRAREDVGSCSAAGSRVGFGAQDACVP